MSPRERVRARVLVSGRVQGVNYRAFAKDEAAFRKVAGWVGNSPDGRVEAVFEGRKEAVEAMIRWCHTGSPAAEVRAVEIHWEPSRGERGFRVRR
ncbi:MAG: acylphosphatase [Candidatus Methylomirabilota bacterium]